MILKSSLGLQSQKIFATYYNSSITAKSITMRILVCLVLLTATSFLQIAFTTPSSSDVDKFIIIQETCDVEKLKISGDPSDAGSLKNCAKPQNKQEKANNMRERVRRSYGQNSNCIGIKIKLFCKVFTIDNVAKNICFTFKTRRCVGLD